MSTSARLPKHLRNVLGSDAGEELMSILEELRADRERSEAALAEFRTEVRIRFDAVDKRFDAVDKRFDEVDKRFDEVDKRFYAVDLHVADVKSDLMKWSFVFWCGAVAAVAALAGVLN